MSNELRPIAARHHWRNCMKLDLSCPIELRGYVLSYSGGTPCASVRLYNLFNRRIASFEAIAKWKCSGSERGVAMPFSAERLRAGAENGFKINLTCDRLPDADQLDIVFTLVRFEDGCDDWRAGEGVVVDVAPIGPISLENLEMLKSAAGSDAVCFPEQDSVTWRCVCGRVNHESEENCARCRRSRKTALSFTPERVCEACPPAASHESEEAVIEEMRKSYLSQRSGLMRRTLAMAIAALALTVLLVMQYRPNAVNASAEIISVYSQSLPQEE